MSHTEFWTRYRQLQNSGLNPELVRFGVNQIKQLASYKVPEYDLPADSFIEFAVMEILTEAKKPEYENKYE